MPVVLRIPRIVEESASPEPLLPRHSEFRWRVGAGVAVLFLVAALPWLIRWRPEPPIPLETLGPSIALHEEAEVEVLPPLYAQTTRDAYPMSAGNDLGLVEMADYLEIPLQAGGTP